MTPLREREKENIGMRIPVDLAQVVREQAVRERRPLNDLATEALARYIGEDPAKYGVKDKSGDRRKKKHQAVTSKT